MVYLTDLQKPDRKIYRYKLRQEGKIKLSDGIIVIEAEKTGGTRYTEYDFWDANWGPVKTFAPGRIWKDSVEGIYLSDIAIKLKAEHPDWSYKRIAEESKGLMEKFPYEPELKRRKKFLVPPS
jgi:hypothetical protein